MRPQASFDCSWDEKTGYWTKQLLSAPIKFKDQFMGVIQLLNKVNGKFFTLEDQHAVTEIAKVLAIAFFNHRRNQEYAAAPTTKFDYLITGSIITQKELEKAMFLARRTGSRVEEALIKEFKVSRTEIGKSLSIFYNTRYIPFEEDMVIPGQLLKKLKPAYLKKNLFVPVEKTDSKIVIAMENPRDLPAQDAIEASLTGHLVFSTLHTNSATETVTRLLDMGMDPFNFADALIGILAQRLIRVVCTHCREGYHPSREEYDAIVIIKGSDLLLTLMLVNTDKLLSFFKGYRRVEICPISFKISLLFKTLYLSDNDCRVGPLQSRLSKTTP
jgi:hypothetical protein